MAEQILISEIFGPTIQGDGALAGRPTVFVRTGCNGLDAAQGNYEAIDAGEIMRRVWKRSKNQPCWISLSGENPAAQPLAGLIDLAHYGYGCKVTLEIDGRTSAPWLNTVDHLVVAPQPGPNFDHQQLNRCLDAHVAVRPLSRLRDNTSMRVVVGSLEDYDFARRVWLTSARPLGIPFFLSPGNADVLCCTRWLVDLVAGDRWYDVTISPPLRSLLWGSEAA